jgi:Trk-type K+ transport system membrane component
LIAANVLVAIVVLVVFAADVGYELPERARNATHNLVRFVLASLVVFEVVQLFRMGLGAYWGERKVAFFVALFAIADLTWGAQMYAVLGGGDAEAGGRAGLLVLWVLAVNGLRVSRKFATREIPPSWLIIFSFVALILLGTFLLKLPNASAGAEMGWLDALFTATSAVTVTGLTVVDTGSDLSGLGQGIVLLLLQIGGLGVMTLTYFVAVVLKQDLTLRDRLMISEIVSEQRVSEGAKAVVRIVVTTLVLELIGSLLLLASLSDLPDERHAIFSSVFHSISAFCNAGFSIYDESLADPEVVGRVGFQLTMMALIVLGGLGFPVLQGLWTWLRKGWKAKRVTNLEFSFTLHARLALVTTSILLIGGSFAVYMGEYMLRDGEVGGGRALSSAFLSVTARTAGFNTIDTGGLGTTTAMIVILLMAIGGGPAGTAGGIRTTTVSVALLNTRRVLLDREHLRAFGVRIPDRLAGRALAIITLSLAWIGSGTWVMTMLHPELAVLDLGFEVVSAFSTVGLSRGVTGDLGPWARALLILTMFAGRVGILAFISAFVRGRKAPRVDDEPVGILL